MENPQFQTLQLDTLAASVAAYLIQSFTKEEIEYFNTRLQSSIDIDAMIDSVETRKRIIGLPVVTVLPSNFEQ